jgi:serine/threonine-protein kinase
VWKAARREPFVELVALKILKPALSRNPDRLAQFRREAERGGRLAGPALLPVYELGMIDGYHFMAMPYVQGITLRDVIRSRVNDQSGAPAQAIHHLVALDQPHYLQAMTRILARATRALARAHNQQIAHRDIKPAKILLATQGRGGVYLCDFGLGRDLEVATSEQMRDGAGTPMYMAPERLLRILADEIRCDIYSMGVTLFEALTLARPFVVPPHVTLTMLPAYLVGASPRAPGDVHPDFPEEHAAVIQKAMARDPNRRYVSAEELAGDLDRLGRSASLHRPRAVFDQAHRPYHPRPHSRSASAPISRRRVRRAAGVRESHSGAAESPGPQVLTGPLAS